MKNYEFAFSKNVHFEIWLQLIEKAYAKVFGCYYNINGGFPSYALRDLTGAPYERITDFKDLDDLWYKITIGHKKGHIITTSILPSEYGDDVRRDGLINGHAYCVIDSQEVMDFYGRTQKIVKIRNIWGGYEWKGDWSDDSKLWTDDLKQRLKLVRLNDGIFWMSIEDLTNNFDEIGISKVYPNYFHNHIELEIGHNKKNIVKLFIQKDSHTYVSLNQEDSRFFHGEQGQKYIYSYYRVTIGK